MWWSIITAFILTFMFTMTNLNQADLIEDLANQSGCFVEEDRGIFWDTYELHCEEEK